MWGELAWQLGGAEGYSLAARADEARTSPGERLIELLERYSPCLILIDEWVAYARQLYGRDDLPGGSFDTQMTFAQTISDAAKGVKDAMLVVSIPQRYSARRRVARTIYMGSAPTLHQTNRGIDDRSIKLGCVQPGESPAIFGDALRRLSTRAMYLSRTTASTGTRSGRQSAAQLRTASSHGSSRSTQTRRFAGGCSQCASGAHLPACTGWPRGPTEVPDEDQARLVVLGPDRPHASGTDVTAARAMVDAILVERAAGPRVNRNMLVFVAPDKARLEELRDGARSFLAWASVVGDHEELNLDAQQRRHAETQRRQFDETVTQRIGESFVWLLTPRQEAGKSEVTWEQTRVTGQEPIPVRVSRKLALEEGLITEYSGARLRMDLDRVPLWPDNHVGSKELWSYYAQYLYLPRLRDRMVLPRAIEQGVGSLSWEQEAFAYADAYDEEAGRYRGLVAGQHVNA